MKLKLLLFLIPSVLFGCNANPSEFVEVNFKVAVPESTQSSMVSVFLFDADSGEARGGFFMPDYVCEAGVRVFSQTENLRQGKYTAIAYNMDAAGVEVRSESNLSTFEFITRSSSDTTFMAPGELAAAKVYPVNVYSGNTVAIDCPLITTATTVRVGANGLKYATSNTGCVSGFGSSYLLDSGKAVASEKLSFDMNAASSDTLAATICSFGEVGPKYDFTFNVTTSGGAYKYIATTDNTFRFPGSIDIPAPAPGSGSGKDGFAPEVGQWKEYSINVPV